MSSKSSNTSQPLTREQVRTVDQLAVSELRIPSIVLMENAAGNAARWILSRYEQAAGRVHVFCGTGNNGGDGFAIARHLHNAGRGVRVVVVGDCSRLTKDAAINHGIVLAMGLGIDLITGDSHVEDIVGEMEASDLIVDAMLGTGFAGSVRQPMADVVSSINAATVRGVISVDVPSGLDCDLGTVGNVAVRADATVTFVGSKVGFYREAGPEHVGEVVVAGIGTPPWLTERVLKTGGGGSV